jgi:hypothetical protein
MRADIHWVSGPWQGKLCIGPRPRGDDWLDDDIARLRSEGIDTILSLLTTEEGRNLGLRNEGSAAETHGITFISFPIPICRSPLRAKESCPWLPQLIQNCPKDETCSYTVVRG